MNNYTINIVSGSCIAYRESIKCKESVMNEIYKRYIRCAFKLPPIQYLTNLRKLWWRGSISDDIIGSQLGIQLYGIINYFDFEPDKVYRLSTARLKHTRTKAGKRFDRKIERYVEKHTCNDRVFLRPTNRRCQNCGGYPVVSIYNE